MTINQMLKELEQLRDKYRKYSKDMELSASTRSYYYGKYVATKTAIGYLRYFEQT